MLRVCSLGGINAMPRVWRKQSEEPWQVTMYSARGALSAIIESASPSTFRHLIMTAARTENGPAYGLQSACFDTPSNLGTCNSVYQPGGAK
jgi:hypothetical protein